MSEISKTTAGAPARRAWLLRLGMLAVAVAVVLAVPRFIGEIDWGSVRSAFGKLAWWQLLLLGVLVVPRQVVKALPLSFFIRGVNGTRALVCDLGTLLMLAVAPPPSYMALRLAMFDSWSINIAKALAGSILGTAVFQFIRFATPAIGFVVLFAAGRAVSYRWAELIFVAIALAIVVVLVQIVRSDVLASMIGVAGGRIARVVRPAVDPSVWGRACVGFRADVAEGFAGGFLRSTLAIVTMVVLDFVILVLSLRFVGLSAAEISLTDVAIAYLFAYPLTFMPFSGIGVVDAILLAGLVDAAGAGIESAAVAGLVLWRVFTVAQPVVMGLGAVLSWRRTLPAR